MRLTWEPLVLFALFAQLILRLKLLFSPFLGEILKFWRKVTKNISYLQGLVRIFIKKMRDNGGYPSKLHIFR